MNRDGTSHDGGALRNDGTILKVTDPRASRCTENPNTWDPEINTESPFPHFLSPPPLLPLPTPPSPLLCPPPLVWLPYSLSLFLFSFSILNMLSLLIRSDFLFRNDNKTENQIWFTYLIIRLTSSTRDYWFSICIRWKNFLERAELYIEMSEESRARSKEEEKDLVSS